MAVLHYAAGIFGEDLILLSDDIKSYFNQFRTHPSEWFKCCFSWLHASALGPVPVWIVEYVLGFGMMPSSGIAQRFSHALLWILRRRFDASEREPCSPPPPTPPFPPASPPAPRSVLNKTPCPVHGGLFTDGSIFVSIFWGITDCHFRRQS
jgi:hypothetical protein